jgi:hypothetical protein
MKGKCYEYISEIKKGKQIAHERRDDNNEARRGRKFSLSTHKETFSAND